MRATTGVCFLLLLVSAPAFGQLTPIERRLGLKADKVKGERDFGCWPGTEYCGEVLHKTDRLLILRHQDDPKVPPVDITFYAVDVLREGGVHDSAKGAFSYRWADVKEKDTISLKALIEKGGDCSYCTELCVMRRPGGPLPKAQFPKEDGRYGQASIFNAIENGEDVSEAEIKKVFPHKDPPIKPGVTDRYFFPTAYRNRLTANREQIRADLEKKEQALKAQPPQKREK